MGDWLGLGVFVLALVGAVAGLSHLGKPREPMSAEEFERRAAEARGTTRGAVFAAMHALQKLINPKAAEAVEVQRDLRAGFYDDQDESGDGEDKTKEKGQKEKG